MSVIIDALGKALGVVMSFCYTLINNYGLAIIAFTFLTKLVMLPIAVWVHKNGIKIIKLQPQINYIKAQYYGDEERISEEQARLYKVEKYNPLVSIVPLFVQIILLMGLVQVIYHPMEYLFQMPADLIAAINGIASQITGTPVDAPSIQLSAINEIKNAVSFPYFEQLAVHFPSLNVNAYLAALQNMQMQFVGLNISIIPTVTRGWAILIPLIATFSSWLLCYAQNKANVLQSEQGKVNKYSTMALSMGLSFYLGWFVPAGVALYWIVSNIFAILQMFALNKVISPKKYVDYEALEKSREELKALESLNKGKNKQTREEKQREKADYKRFFSVENKHLAFYSEKSGFYKYFKNIIEYLLAHSNVIIHYITNDPDDAIFLKAASEPRIKPYYIGPQKIITLMMKMDVDIIVMTTPDLNQFHIKRSYMKSDIEYIYTFHGLTSTTMAMRAGAYDYFDTILCVGQHQIDELRETEQMYHLSAKNLIPTGFCLLDDMIAGYNADSHYEKSKKRILIAPSWQEDNILDSCIDELLLELLPLGEQVVVRPHPEYIKRYKARMELLLNKYENKLCDDFIIETDFSSNQSVFSADVLITDWSGIAYEFSFTTLKPSLFINTKMKVLNKDYVKYKHQPSDITLRNLSGVSIEKNEINRVSEIIRDMISNPKVHEEQIRDTRNNYVFNLGHSGEVAGKYILSRLVSIHSK